MRLYKFYSAKWGLAALEKGRLKITTGDDINDPFELAAVQLGNRSLRDVFNQHRKAMFSKIGIVSFCRKWSNPVIWSHYAEAHRGLCLGFDVLDAHTIPIDYVSKRIPFDLNGLAPSSAPSDAIGARLLRTKFSHWRYENEVRILCAFDEPGIVQENTLRFTPFTEDLRLREVILGPLYESRGYVAMQRALQSDGIEIITARAAFKTFSVVRQRVSRLAKSL